MRTSRSSMQVLIGGTAALLLAWGASQGDLLGGLQVVAPPSVIDLPMAQPTADLMPLRRSAQGVRPIHALASSTTPPKGAAQWRMRAPGLPSAPLDAAGTTPLSDGLTQAVLTKPAPLTPPGWLPGGKLSSQERYAAWQGYAAAQGNAPYATRELMDYAYSLPERQARQLLGAAIAHGNWRVVEHFIAEPPPWITPQTEWLEMGVGLVDCQRFTDYCSVMGDYLAADDEEVFVSKLDKFRKYHEQCGPVANPNVLLHFDPLNPICADDVEFEEGHPAYSDDEVTTQEEARARPRLLALLNDPPQRFWR